MSDLQSGRSAGLSSGEWGAVGFTVAYMLVWLATSLVVSNREFLYYFAVMCVLFAVVATMHLRVRFSLAALWGLSLWGLAHMAGGLLPVPQSWPTLGETRVLYNLWLLPGLVKYDQAVHAFGFGLVTWICWQCLARTLAEHEIAPKPTVGLLTLCAAAGMGFGALNEVVEFFAVLMLPGTNVGGYENTGWDLIANMVGALTAAVLVRAANR